MRRIHREQSEVVSGFPLESLRGRGWFSLIVPKEATNLDTNPSFELGTTGVTTLNSSVARSAAEQRRGIYSLAVTPSAAGTDGGFYKTYSLTADVFYSLSFDLLGQPGETYVVGMYTTAPAQVFTFTQDVSQRGTGAWVRLSVKGTVTSTASYRFYVYRQANTKSTTRPFYVDGFLLEVGEPSSYFDGDFQGFITGQTAYSWQGTPHASTSTRSGATRSGGTSVNLKDLGFTLLAVVGLGHAPLRTVTTPLGYLDGATYQRTVRENQVFSLIGSLSGNNLEQLKDIRADLINYLDPDVGGLQQPLVLEYRGVDDCGNLFPDVYRIICTYQGGLEGNIDNLYQERIALQFSMPNPYVLLDGDEAVSLGYTDNVTANFALKREDNVWQPVTATGFNDSVNAVATDYAHGRVYFGGMFTTADGNTVNRLAYLNVATGTLHKLGTGGTVGVNAPVQALAVAPNGDVWIGGDFTTVEGAATDGLTRYNAATNNFTAFTQGPVGAVIHAIAVTTDGVVIFGGDFASWNADANQAYITTYNPATTTFAPLGQGMNGIVLAIISTGTLAGGLIFAAGEFTTSSSTILGVVTTNRLSIWYPNAQDNEPGWTAPVGGGANARIRDIYLNRLNFTLLVGGDFTTTGPLTESPSLAVYFGGWHNALAANSNLTGANKVDSVLTIRDGLYFGVDFTGEVGLGYAPAIGGFFSGIISAADVFLDLQWDFRDEIIYAGLVSAISVDGPASTTVVNNGHMKTYPQLTIEGPGTLVSIANQTTGATIRFNNYAIQTGEKVVLNFDPIKQSFVSSTGENLYSEIEPGSDTDRFFLVSGNNVIQLFIANDTPALTLLSWTPRFPGIM